jgi:hypothetical protein
VGPWARLFRNGRASPSGISDAQIVTQAQDEAAGDVPGCGESPANDGKIRIAMSSRRRELRLVTGSLPAPQLRCDSSVEGEHRHAKEAQRKDPNAP